MIFGLAAELADPGDEGFVQEAALGEIVQERDERGFRRRQEVVLEAMEIVAVRVPERVAVVVPVDRNQRHAALDKPAGEEHALPVDIPPVAVAERVRFLGKIKRLAGGFRGQ